MSAAASERLLEAVASREDASVVRHLLEAGADIECARPADEGRLRPLHIAAYRTDERAQPLLQALLDCGADPNAAAGGGQTPLLVALATAHLPAARALLAAGADPKRANVLGHAPMMYAACESHEAVDLLLEAGAEPLQADRDGWTALDWCSLGGLSSEKLRRVAGIPVRNLAWEEETVMHRETPEPVDSQDGSSVPPQQRSRAADYLASGYPLLEYGNDESWLSDGAWAWRRYLATRVGDGQAGLPQRFLAAMQARSYCLPFVDPLKLYFKIFLFIRAIGATYAVPGSAYGRLHRYFCSLP